MSKLRGDLAMAEDHYRRSLALNESVAPDSRQVAGNLNNLGSVAQLRGDLAAAEDYHRRALAIRERVRSGSPSETLQVAMSLHNLGVVATVRGDLATAGDYFRRALAVRETLAPGSLEVAQSLNNLGNLAQALGDLGIAEEHYRRALHIHEKVAPQGLGVAASLANLGLLARDRRDWAAAEDHLRRGLALRERVAPESMEAAEILEALGDVARGRGDLARAETDYRRALAIRQEKAPGSAEEAGTCHRLARIHRERGQREGALGFHRRALDALEVQRARLGGTDEVKSGFAAQHAAYYRDTIALLMELGRAEEAFHVLERYRARELLALLAERDLVFSLDVPVELDRERRMADSDYDRALAELAKAAGADAAGKREALDQVRRRQAQIRDRIRDASPRLGGLQYPQPLDLAGARAALDPGTLLLSYSIGEEKSYLFAVGPGASDFVAVALDTDLARLRADVGRFRQLLQQGMLGRAQLQQVSRTLSITLLAPARGPLARAERLLILPDGPLHLIPFAALRDPSRGGGRYLVEARPVHVAASATVFAELKKGRRPERPARLVAFGDPDYSALASQEQAGTATPAMRSARLRGLDLRPLPASRKEVDALRELYAPASRTFLGAEATEERARAVSGEASLLHLACHALADETSPLESSLALSLPVEWQPGRPNGLLQAWEIFEQVRIDADLVTLSACGTALGKEMSGEGVLGLTRAFQYAGARSVLASLWTVNDESTAELMRRFYGHLRRGRSKDAALQAAQVEMIRGSSHPSRWAAFQLTGDWR